MRRCATIKAQLALRRQWFAFTNHVGSVLIASTSGRGAPLSPRARCLRSFVSPSFLIDYTLTIFHSPPGFSGHLNEFPNAAPPHPVLFSRTPDGISPHICIIQTECPNNPREMFRHPGKSYQNFFKNTPPIPHFTQLISDLHVHYIQSKISCKAHAAPACVMEALTGGEGDECRQGALKESSQQSEVV